MSQKSNPDIPFPISIKIYKEAHHKMFLKNKDASVNSSMQSKVRWKFVFLTDFQSNENTMELLIKCTKKITARKN